jgi:hypothetical protein
MPVSNHSQALRHVHGGGGAKGLKSELFAPNVPGAAQFARSHRLGNGPFHTSPLGIYHSKRRRSFLRASGLSRSIGQLIGVQDQHAGGTVPTLLMERTRMTDRRRKPHANHGFSMMIGKQAPALTKASSRAGHLVGLPINGKLAVIEALSRRGRASSDLGAPAQPGQRERGSDSGRAPPHRQSPYPPDAAEVRSSCSANGSWRSPRICPSGVVAAVVSTSTMRWGAAASQVWVKWTDVSGPDGVFLPTIARLRIVRRGDDQG